MILRLVPLVILFVLALVVYRKIINSHWLQCWLDSLKPAPDTDDEVIRHLDDAEMAANRRAVEVEMEAAKKREAAEAIRRRTQRT